ncbi:MAG: Asp-tRNA(Asn)/Glu-tRNA(Gln) amidotransferase subunit GatC [Oscillospiraceae bacterium]|jgi:aspartyl-tRNA(Asn)/glutamyl-tRNA(Gln) amidotransferase subunit C|nr:Asp-tRNA(Asn)/Glu-tRNA(Gln) amidotransferase subunit GatC [Oscillospiraceae bacterium]
MIITNEIVSYIAELSRIRLSDGQAEKMKDELGVFIDYMGILNQLDTEGVEPMSHVFSLTNAMRTDEVNPSYERAELLKNAPEHTDSTVVVPKVVE